MFEIGRKQTLFFDHKVDFGIYLCEEENLGKRSRECVLLPGRQVPKNLRVGDPLEVFIYKDSGDRLIATVNEPKLEIGELAVLKVSEVTSIGAFMDWGLEKELLLPFSEQVVKVKKGESYLVGLYLDKSERLCATMKIYDFLRTDSSYKKDDTVEGVVFGHNPEYGAFVAVDHMYTAMIPEKEMVRKLRIGETVHARVTEHREDGKLNLSLREKTNVQMDVDSAKIMERLSEAGGFLPYHDKSPADEIKEAFGMSKNEFKRAIGRLYKNRSITIGTDGIRIV